MPRDSDLELWMHQARLLASSIRREIRLARKALEKDRPIEEQVERIRSLTETLQIHLRSTLDAITP